MHVNHISYNKATYFSGLVTLFCYWVRFIVFFFLVKKPATFSQGIQLFRERLSDKVHATTPKGIVGGF